MVVTAVVTALVMFAFGALLMRLLHITGRAVAVAGGMILAILASDGYARIDVTTLVTDAGPPRA